MPENDNENRNENVPQFPQRLQQFDGSVAFINALFPDQMDVDEAKSTLSDDKSSSKS